MSDSQRITITEVDSAVYAATFAEPSVVYNSVAFAELNAHKVKAVKHLLISEEGKPFLGLTIGETADGLRRAPFSAPFACFDSAGNVQTSSVIAAIRALRSSYPGLKLTLPPPVYSPMLNAQTVLALRQERTQELYDDWNYHLDLTADGGYAALLDHSARKKVRRATRYGLTLKELSFSELGRVYSVIEQNRRHKGYPLKMSENALHATIYPAGPIAARAFVLTDGEIDFCAAIIYEVAPQIAQVIYWGDIPNHDYTYAMNLLAAELYAFYKALDFKVLDIGPSSEGGVASEGLCRFKESIGCTLTPKPTFLL